MHQISKATRMWYERIKANRPGITHAQIADALDVRRQNVTRALSPMTPLRWETLMFWVDTWNKVELDDIVVVVASDGYVEVTGGRPEVTPCDPTLALSP